MKPNGLCSSVASVVLVLGTLAVATVAYGESRGPKDAKHVKMGTHHAVKVTNSSGQRLTHIDIQLSGDNASEFSQTNNCGKKLDDGDSCTISVTFAPTSAGPKSATMRVHTSAGEESVILTGTGTVDLPRVAESK